MKKPGFLYRNGLSLVFLTLFLVTLLAQAFTGWKEHNQELREEHTAELAFSTYLGIGHFIWQLLKIFRANSCKLAKRIPVCTFNSGSNDLLMAERFAGIKTGRRPAYGNRQIK